MEPFGPDNLRPVFIVRNVADTGYSRILKEQHVRFSLRQGNFNFTGIGFNMADRIDMLHAKTAFRTLCLKIDENEWNGEKNLQIRVLDCRLSPSDN
jgi:single-stranded-DNA-specific exonuclease